MTDLLAPLLSVIDDEIEAFWSFTNLMESNSICRPGKSEMSIKHQLVSFHIYAYRVLIVRIYVRATMNHYIPLSLPDCVHLSFYL